jgi:hypothetical protein
MNMFIAIGLALYSHTKSTCMAVGVLPLNMGTSRKERMGK